MKKIALIIFILFSVCFVSLSMAENTIVGEWDLIEIQQNGETINVATTGETVTLEILQNNTLTLNYSGDLTYGSWSQNDNKFIVDGQEAELKDDKLYLLSNGLIMVFARQSIGSAIAQLFSGTHQKQSGDYSFRDDYESVDQASKSVFYVEIYDNKNRMLGSGSAFVCFKEHLLVTNQHVINGASYLKIWDEDDKMYLISKVASIDKTHDIAILQFQDGSKYNSLNLDYEVELKRGQPVITMGSPQGFQGTIAYGNISAFPVLERYGNAKCIQYTAPISHGSSGGCLFDDNGKVIGITTAISEEGQNIGIAIPVEYLQRLYLSWDKSFVDLDSSKLINGDRESVASEGYRKDDYTDITGGVVDRIVELPKYIEDTVEHYSMRFTLPELLDEYEKIRKTVVKGAPEIKNPELKDGGYGNGCYMECDMDNGIGMRVSCAAESNNTLDLPVNYIVILLKENTKANARACMYKFVKDIHLLDKLIDFYNNNDCYWNNSYAAILTSEGYLIEYYGGGVTGSGGIIIYNVVPY